MVTLKILIYLADFKIKKLQWIKKMSLLLEPLVFLYNSSVAVLIVVSVGQPCGEPPYTAISYLHICFQETKFILFSILRRDWIYNCHSSAC